MSADPERTYTYNGTPETKWEQFIARPLPNSNHAVTAWPAPHTLPITRRQKAQAIVVFAILALLALFALPLLDTTTAKLLVQCPATVVGAIAGAISGSGQAQILATGLTVMLGKHIVERTLRQRTGPFGSRFAWKSMSFGLAASTGAGRVGRTGALLLV